MDGGSYNVENNLIKTQQITINLEKQQKSVKNAKNRQKPLKTTKTNKKVARANKARAKERTDKQTHTDRLPAIIIYSEMIQHVHFVKFYS